MKILYITNGINGPGGLERVLSIKASMLADKYGYEIIILGLNKGNENPFYSFSSKIKFVNIDVPSPKHPLNYFRDYKKGIRTVVQNEQPHIIAVCDNGLKAFFIPKFLKTNAKIIYERHNSKMAEMQAQSGFLKRAFTKLKWKLMSQLGKAFDTFIVLTEGNKKEWKGLNNIKIIPNPLSFTNSQPSPLDQQIVICVGAISYQKGQDILIESWKKVHRRFPTWELHLYGQENLSFLNTNKLPRSIKYFPPTPNIQEKYRNSAIYVMSSRFEGFGMVLIEAMVMGVPCISFDCPYGPSDIIKNNVDGFIVEKENGKKLAEKIEFLIANPQKRKKMGLKAFSNVKRYKAAPIVNTWDQLFKSLTA